MKIRTLGGAQDSVIKALGGVPVQIPAPDLYTALQRGTVDGTIMAYTSAQSYKMDEICQVRHVWRASRRVSLGLLLSPNSAGRSCRPTCARR